MKIAIYSPYLDTAGGGEKYILTIAEILARSNQVYVLLDSHLVDIGAETIREKIIKLHDLDLSKVNFIDAPLGKGSAFFKRIFFLRRFDVLFYLTDGSIFYPTAKKNILHIQSPLIGQPSKSLWGKFKLKGWDLIVYNSKFTQDNSKNYWQKDSMVIYPPVDIDRIKPLEKKKYILSVGRFFGYLKDKKHEFMIDAFKKLKENSDLDEWSLHLAGSAALGDKKYLADLKKKAKGLDIRFYPNLEYEGLVKLYGESSIYWHASGYQEDDPTKMEHFGISTVEAMAGGCVPIVINRGGQTEIVEHGKSGLLWSNLDDLESLTLRVINEDGLWKNLSNNARIRARIFSKEKFVQSLNQLMIT